MREKKYRHIIGLIIVAMIGLIVLQTYLLNYAVNQKKKAFEANVRSAMNLIVSKLETREIITGIFLSDDSTSTDSFFAEITTDVVEHRGNSEINKELFLQNFIDDKNVPLKINNDSILYTVENPQHIEIYAFSQNCDTNFTLVDAYKDAGAYSVGMPIDIERSETFSIRMDTDSTSFFVGLDNANLSYFPHDSLNKKNLVMSVFNRLSFTEWLPIEQRLDQVQLDSTIKNSLAESGIDVMPEYGIIIDTANTIPIISDTSYQSELVLSDFKAQIFPNDIYAPRTNLALYFPDQTAFIWKQMIPLTISITVFMLIIIFCFIYALKIIFRQKKFAGRMVDFINNMTHEFKTPISTVALASEAIGRPDIIIQKEKVARYNQMIQDENKRMRRQVEKILQMAVLEEGDYDLNLTEINLHQIINKAVENSSIQIDNNNGSIALDLQAEKYQIRADNLHLTNIIHNLLDNAIKYSPEKPEIILSTKNHQEGIIISITDHGIGISESMRKSVFDKYYRVSSGNVHNVKGFGLGLSYVKLMTEAQGGTVKLDSTENRGTTVQLYFPQAFKTE